MKLIITTTILTVIALLSYNLAFSQWEPSGSGIIASSVNCFIEAPDGSVLAGTSGGIFHSSDFGNNWISSSNGLSIPFDTILCFTTNGPRIFAGTNQSVYYSDDNGTSWFSSGLQGMQIADMGIDNGLVLAGTEHGLYQSNDNGSTWTLIPESPSVLTFQISTNLWVVGGAWGRIFTSEDQGLSWSWSSSSQNYELIYKVVGNQNKLFAGIYVDHSWEPYEALISSTTNGQFWSFVNAQGFPILGNLEFKALCTWTTNVLVGSGNEILHSFDNGSSWETLMDGFSPTPPYEIKCFESTSNYIFCGLEVEGVETVYRFPKDQIPNSINPVEETQNVQVFPNPSSGERITLNYRKLTGDENRWIIFDSLGRCVANESLTTTTGLFALSIKLEAGTYISQVTDSKGLIHNEQIIVLD